MRYSFGLVCGVAAAILVATTSTFGRGLPGPERASGTVKTQDQAVRQGLAIGAYTLQDLALPAEPGQPFEVFVTLGGARYTLNLVPHSVRAPGFQLLVQGENGAMTSVPAPAPATYRGTIDEFPGSIVSASLIGGRLSAMVRIGGQDALAWAIQPLSEVVPGAPAARHVVYRVSDTRAGDWRCGVGDDEHPGHGGAGAGSPRGPGDQGNLVCEIACDADFEFFTINGSNVATTTADVENIINHVSAIYASNCQIEMQISTTIVRSSSASNPYTSSDPNTLLNQFKAYWGANHGAVHRDLAHLFTGRELAGSVIGIAFLNGICNTNAYGLVQSRFTPSLAARTALTAHETGHNFSAQHCDTLCNPCKIMCSGLGGCSGILTSFSTCDIASITGYAATRACLTPPPPPVLALPFFDDFPTTTINATKWPIVGGATINANAVSERSAPNSLDLALVSTAECANLDTTTPSTLIFVSFWSEHRGVEAGKTLTLKYFRQFFNDFNTLTTLTSDGVDQSRFAFNEFKLPFDGFSANASRIRFEAAGNQLDDHWFIDDVSVSIHCRADINKDHALNINDFISFQTAFGIGNALIADYNNDGLMNINDFIAYQTAFALGCY